jgi:hypothetical protein
MGKCGGLSFSPRRDVTGGGSLALVKLLQHRRMRDAGLRDTIRETIRSAVMERESDKHDVELYAAWGAFSDAGGAEDDWEEPFEFDEAAAQELANDGDASNP